MNDPSTPPPPKLSAVTHYGAGCFPVILLISAVVIYFIFRSYATRDELWTAIIIAGVAALLALPAWWRRRKFVRQSAVIQGHLTRLWQTVFEDENGGQITYYYCAYTFPGGQPTSQQIEAKQCLFAKLGDPVTVRYLPDQPSVSQVDWELTLSEKLRTIETPLVSSRV